MVQRTYECADRHDCTYRSAQFGFRREEALHKTVEWYSSTSTPRIEEATDCIPAGSPRSSVGATQKLSKAYQRDPGAFISQQEFTNAQEAKAKLAYADEN